MNFSFKQSNMISKVTLSLESDLWVLSFEWLFDRSLSYLYGTYKQISIQSEFLFEFMRAFHVWTVASCYLANRFLVILDKQQLLHGSWHIQRIQGRDYENESQIPADSHCIFTHANPSIAANVNFRADECNHFSNKHEESRGDLALTIQNEVPSESLTPCNCIIPPKMVIFMSESHFYLILLLCTACLVERFKYHQ